MKALLIEFDIETGERPGGINPRTDRGLPCPSGWQNIDANPAVEIRMVGDNRDTSVYEGVPGITVLDGKEAINAAVTKFIPASRYSIFNQDLMLEHMKQKGISIDGLVGKTADQVAEFGFKHSLAGVIETKTKKLR